MLATQITGNLNGLDTQTGGGNYNSYQKYKESQKPVKPETKVVYVNNDSGGGGGGESSFHTTNDDIINKIKKLLNEQNEQAKAYHKTLYDQQLAQNKQAWENNRNQINLNYARGDRYLKGMYGDAVSGHGLSNAFRNNANWRSNLAENQQNFTNNNATAQAQYNMNLANTASQLAQGWYNYVLPVYTNRQQIMDDYDYRKYLATL